MPRMTAARAAVEILAREGASGTAEGCTRAEHGDIAAAGEHAPTAVGDLD